MRSVQFSSIAFLVGCATAPYAPHATSDSDVVVAPSVVVDTAATDSLATEAERASSAVALATARPLAPAETTTDNDYQRTGATLGVGATWPFTYFDLDREENALGQNISVEETLGGEGRIGYRFLPGFAIEGVYQYLNNLEFNSGGTRIAEARAWDATANLKGYLPFDAFQPYGFAGFGVFNLDFNNGSLNGVANDQTEMMWRFGAGFDAYLARHVVFYGEAAYNRPLNDLRDFDFMTISAGIQYRF